MLDDFKQCRKIDKAVFLVLVACNLVALFLLGRAYYGNPDSSISAIKQQQQIAAKQVDGARADVNDAKQAAAAASTGIDRVQARIEQSTNLARANAEQIDKCRELVRGCRILTESNGAILDNVRDANKTGKTKAEIHTK